RKDHVLAKGAYASYHDSRDNYVQTVVPAISAALATTKNGRGLVFGAPPAIWSLPAPNALGGIFLPSACGRNVWGFASMSHALLYGKAPNLHLGSKPTTVKSTDRAEKNGHPCPKPLSWMMWAVGLASVERETVLDPFMGSGTTGVAAVKMGRKFIGIEIET